MKNLDNIKLTRDIDRDSMKKFSNRKEIEDFINTNDHFQLIYQLYLQESDLIDDNTLLNRFESQIDFREVVSDEDLISEFRYISSPADKQSLVEDKLQTALKDVEISDDDYRILFDNILYRLKQNTDAYVEQLKIHLN